MPAGVNTQCTLATCTVGQGSFLSYNPSLAGNAFYVALFGTIFVVQAFQSLNYRTWTFSGSMLVGLVLEVVGYVGRVQVHFNPWLESPFIVYISCITIAPVFFSAGIYICLSRIIVHYGVQHAHVSAKTISIGFMTSDWSALVLQAVGGAIADLASTRHGQDQGVHIMVAGLALQVLTLLVFMGVAVEFAWSVKRQVRHRKENPSGQSWEDVQISSRKRPDEKSFKMFLLALSVATILILIRSSFRVAELSKGFNSKLANEQIPYMILEGAMISLAVILLTAFHPGRAFGARWPEAGWSWRKGSSRP